MAEHESAELRRLSARVEELEAELVRLRAGPEGFPSQFESARLLFDAVPIASVYIDKDCVYRFANRAYLSLFGLSASQLLGASVSQSLGAEAFEAVRPDIERALAGNVVTQQKLVPYPPERGGTRLVESVLVPDRRRDGSTAGFLGLMIDATPRYRAEQALRESEERYRRLVELAPYAIVVHAGGHVVYANAMTKSLLGLEPTVELAGQPILDFVHPDSRVVALERIRGLLDHEGDVPTIEAVFLRADDRAITVETKGLSVQWQGRPAVQSIFQDITARKAQEQALHDASERLTAQSRELEQRVAERTNELTEKVAELELFAYSVSHDLRAPLRAMHGLTRALLEDHADRLDDEGRDYATRIAAASVKLDSLIRDLLEYNRLGRADLGLEPVDLASPVRAVLHGLEADIRACDAAVEVRPPLPRVLAHADTLALVIQNLVGNALKFVHAGQSPRIEIEAEVRDGRARLWVIDEGIGVEAAHVERIFDVFERLHGGDAYPGTGIGLAIVRKAVSRMGGLSGVVSTPGRGSRFWIELPVAPASAT